MTVIPSCYLFSHFDRKLNIKFILSFIALKKHLEMNTKVFKNYSTLKSVFLFIVVCCFVVDVSRCKEVKKKSVRKYKFIFGRIPPGSFEYPKLNGFYTPKTAVHVCEADPACGGFTFKGTPSIPKQVFEVYFFHFVPKELFEEESKHDQYFHWTSYQVQSRKFVELKNYKFKTNFSDSFQGTCGSKG